MQLFILTTLISFLVAAPSLDGWNDFDHHGGIFRNDIDGAIHSQYNNCNNNVKNIGFGTDDHSDSFNGWGRWGKWGGLNNWD
ncbi:hypothetical protein CONCODRAFT_12983 [Conidiobolus coronatus NRRL 28638]|uniref:Uncharacterized protein n=1 Tax=Conidiobolus coronatus (strain ATCC 28846 / CBS 209.66 / NRRL 28638) TaxID=796925 RepID=A0A137NRQ8_CONC2|nr:hypothetical protein CONCODRAFT_12983 [Conidiobolus coronatus NRRL 28638]|eukprot:KXN65425.1 hypothetical protein CONCODRAFT_12983 [Conidiobolus coronatus NRRL 28638]